MRALPFYLEDHDLIDVLTVAMEELRHLDSEMPMQTAMIFLTAARMEHDQPSGVYMKDLRALVGISQAAMSRNTVILGAGKPGKPGHNLIEVSEDPKHRRRKLIHLSKKGRGLVIKITTRVRDRMLRAEHNNARKAQQEPSLSVYSR